jgi:hypothetical protein
MSAPWLVLPFVAGMMQGRPRRAMAVGLIVTLSALAGYFAMTYSPMEGTPLKDFWSGVSRMVISPPNPLWIVAGSITGPLYGFLGHRWRVARSWVSAVLITVALCFEPLARSVEGTLSHQPIVWGTEIVIGATAGIIFAWMIARGHRTVPPLDPAT